MAVGVQGQELTQGGLVHLDRSAMPAASQVGDLVAQGQADLVGDLAERQVVAREGPRNDRHGAGEHALDGPVGQRLGVGWSTRPSGRPGATRRPTGSEGRVQREP